jgi:DUF4097 and DUF4098 domain-containing protein YvlB
MINEQFDTPGEVDLRVDNKLGPVEVRTHDKPTTEVEVSASGDEGAEGLAKTTVKHSDTGGRHRIVVEVPGPKGLFRTWMRRESSVRVDVCVPQGASIEILTAAGDATARGRFGPARVATASGQVTVEGTDHDLRVRTASGDVVVGSVAGDASIQTASGHVHCTAISGEGEIKTASGNVRVETAGGALTVQTASGDVSTGDLAAGCRVNTASGDLTIERLQGGRARLETVTGDIDVAVSRGAVVAVDAVTVSGALSSDIDLDASEPDLPGEEDLPRLELQARTVSGDLRIERAAAVN